MKLISALLVAAAMASPAAAATLKITISNDAGASGFALTPVYTAFHNGDFDSYTPGESAADFAGLEELAEVGDFGPIRDRRISEAPGSTGAAFFGGPDANRPIFGGESVTQLVNITDTSSQRFFSFLSMIIPTNDTFIGNGNPMAFELFDDMGLFLGPRTISVTGADARDAGTEINGVDNNPAFVQGVNGALGAAENGLIQSDGFSALAQFVGLTTAAGFVLDPSQDVNGAAADFQIATITITQVPLPAGGWLLLGALGMGGFVSRRRKAAA